MLTESTVLAEKSPIKSDWLYVNTYDSKQMYILIVLCAIQILLLLLLMFGKFFVSFGKRSGGF